jgi:hypothetical protein
MPTPATPQGPRPEKVFPGPAITPEITKICNWYENRHNTLVRYGRVREQEIRSLRRMLWWSVGALAVSGAAHILRWAL